MQIKIYDKYLYPITTLFKSDFTDLTCEVNLDSSGYGEFIVRVDNTKINTTALQMYNRVKFYENESCKFYGYITDLTVSLNTIKVRAITISALLKNRLAVNVSNGISVAQAISNVINSMNTIDPTGISLGAINISGTVTNKTYTNGETVEYVLKDLIGDNQMFIDQEGKLNIDSLVGDDLSDTVLFRYDTRMVNNSNLASFSVNVSGGDILTRILARDRNSLTSQVDNESLISTYGIIEKQITYYNDSGVTAINQTAQKDFQDRKFAPDISLSPDVDDNFEVGDVVSIHLYNGFIELRDNLQVQTKTIEYKGDLKFIKVKLNDNEKTILDIIKEHATKINQLELL